jgi:hypothetical protein
MSSTLNISLSVALMIFVVGCGKKAAPQQAQLTPDPCSSNPSGPGCNYYPVQTPLPTPGIAGGCVVIVSPSPSRAGQQVTVNVFTPQYTSLALLGWGTSVEANAVWGTLYNHVTGTMTYPHPGNFVVQATAQDASGNTMSCGGSQMVH